MDFQAESSRRIEQKVGLVRTFIHITKGAFRGEPFYTNVFVYPVYHFTQITPFVLGYLSDASATNAPASSGGFSITAPRRHHWRRGWCCSQSWTLFSPSTLEFIIDG